MNIKHMRENLMLQFNTAAKWQAFLSKWSNEWLSTKTTFPVIVRKEKWLGYEPATDAQLSTVENRLGYRLPPSFRSFLETSNGWRQTIPFIRRIRSASKLNWLQIEEPELVETYCETAFFEEFDGTINSYYSYTPEICMVYNPEHLKSCLLIADPIPGDSMMYFLNPLAVTSDGEWEAWVFANWLPGVRRYPSFAHLMQSEYSSFLQTELGNKKIEGFSGPYSGVYAPEHARSEAQRIGKGKPIPRKLSIEELIAQLEDSSKKKRIDAAKKLWKKFAPHHPEDQKPELFPALFRILNSDLEIEVKTAAIYMLGTYGNASVMEQLAKPVSHEKLAWAALSALRYLSLYYKNKKAADAVCAYLSVPRDIYSIDKGITILHEFRDKRLVNIAKRVIESDSEELFGVELFRIGAALAIIKVDKNAADYFLTLLNSADPEIKCVAAVAVREIGDKRAIPILKALLNDSDSRVRQQAETSIDFITRGVPPSSY
jgi:hypothetical protein